MPRVRFVSPTFYAGVSYAQNQVADLSNEDIKALGDSVERADDRDIEKEARTNDAADPDERRERDVHSEPGDAQDIPDAARDNDADAKAQKEAAAKAVNKAPKDKMVSGATKTK